MPRPKDWNGTKEKNVWTVLDLMRELKVSVKDLSFVIADYSVHQVKRIELVDSFGKLQAELFEARAEVERFKHMAEQNSTEMCEWMEKYNEARTEVEKPSNMLLYHDNTSMEDTATACRQARQQAAREILEMVTKEYECAKDSWLEEKRAAGWTYGPVKDAEKKEHPCFVLYEALPADQQAKDHLFKAIVAALAPLLTPTPDHNQLQAAHRAGWEQARDEAVDIAHKHCVHGTADTIANMTYKEITNDKQ